MADRANLMDMVKLIGTLQRKVESQQEEIDKLTEKVEEIDALTEMVGFMREELFDVWSKPTQHDGLFATQLVRKGGWVEPGWTKYQP